MLPDCSHRETKLLDFAAPYQTFFALPAALPICVGRSDCIRCSRTMLGALEIHRAIADYYRFISSTGV